MKDLRTEKLLTDLRVEYEYVPEQPISELASDPRTQVRSKENQAPISEVERYYKLFQAGADFPPVVITKDGRLIDGNTRWGAYHRARRTTIPAYVCDVTSDFVARRIGVELNSVHGRRMDKSELVAWLASGNGNVTAEDAARITGWSTRNVSRVRGALRFDERRRRLDIPHVTLPEAVREALVKVTDPDCFRALTVLSNEAGLSASEVNEVLRDVNDLSLTDPRGALSVIQTLRSDRKPQIEEHAAGLRVSRPMHRQIAMHMGWVIQQGSGGLLDTNPHTAPKSQRYLEEAQEVIKEALRGYAS